MDYIYPIRLACLWTMFEPSFKVFFIALLPDNITRDINSKTFNYQIPVFKWCFIQSIWELYVISPCRYSISSDWKLVSDSYNEVSIWLPLLKSKKVRNSRSHCACGAAYYQDMMCNKWCLILWCFIHTISGCVW